jgi:hypothetical protein
MYRCGSFWWCRECLTMMDNGSDHDLIDCPLNREPMEIETPLLEKNNPSTNKCDGRTLICCRALANLSGLKEVFFPTKRWLP